MGCVHREQPKISEEGIRPSFVIVQTSPLTRSVLLFPQHRPQSTPDKAVDRREGEAMGMFEVGVPTLQRRVERRNNALDGTAAIARREVTELMSYPPESPGTIE